ncbi:hypothetical protein ACLKMY_35890, partial [Paraburkholderia mimosarum]|uniref:hypothetical protein n=1 Tax=Paraburkholderia mimosarum TaxID=312026 RepID=UPI0039C13265
MDWGAHSWDYSRFVSNRSTLAGVVAAGFSGMLALMRRGAAMGKGRPAPPIEQPQSNGERDMSKTFRIAAIPGDGIGQEVIPEG